MKNRIIELVAFVFGLLTTLAGFLTLPQVALLPQSWQPYIALCLALVIVGKNGFYVVLDFADNGKLDKSYKHGAGLLLVAGLLLGLTSCVMREDGTRTFAGLDKNEWLGLGKDVGKATVKAAVPAYLARRGASGGKEVQDVYIVDWTFSK